MKGKNNAFYRIKDFNNWKEKIKIKPNKTELAIQALLDSIAPNEYKYVGDFTVVIDGKSPDFININGQKKIIEYFGDHWHSIEKKKRNKQEEENHRINAFAEFGYKTLVIWGHELKDIDAVIVKIKEFHEDGRK